MLYTYSINFCGQWIDSFHCRAILVRTWQAVTFPFTQTTRFTELYAERIKRRLRKWIQSELHLRVFLLSFHRVDFRKTHDTHLRSFKGRHFLDCSAPSSKSLQQHARVMIRNFVACSLMSESSGTCLIVSDSLTISFLNFNKYLFILYVSTYM
jgi:hypothetical protein